MKRPLLVIASLLAVTALTAQTYNIRDYGAVGDGVHIDTDAINAAIEAAHAAGGGTVLIPAGTFLSYSVRLKDGITLHLDRGAVLKAGAASPEHQYDAPEPNPSTFQDFGHSHFHNSLIWGEGLHDVAITGFGLIDGTDGLVREVGRVEPVSRGNKAIALKECRGVTIRDISLLMCGHFALLLTGVDGLTIDNVRVDTNRDAFDIDCCANVHISNCFVNTTNDDAIVLKSSYALGYLKPTENVTITNCQVSGYDMGTFFDGTYGRTVTAVPDRDGPTGRIKFGTESNGGFRNITISNCVFDHCRGIALETVDGGPIEDINITNISMREIVNAPLYIRLGGRARGPEGLPFSTIRRVNISNVTVKDADCRYASMLFGLAGHPVEDISLSHIHIQYRGGLTMEDVLTQEKANTFFNRDLGRVPRTDPYDIPQLEKGYPEPSSHGVLPVWGLLVTHARGVRLSDIVLEAVEPDLRPAVLLMDATGVTMEKIELRNGSGAPSVFLPDGKDLASPGITSWK